MERRGDARGAIAPVVPGNRESRQSKRVGEIDQVLANRRLLRHPWRRGVPKACCATAAKVGHQHAMAVARKRSRDTIPRAHVVGESMQQDDRETLRIAALFESDAQHRRVNRSRLRRDIRPCRRLLPLDSLRSLGTRLRERYRGTTAADDSAEAERELE